MQTDQIGKQRVYIWLDYMLIMLLIMIARIIVVKRNTVNPEAPNYNTIATINMF